MLDAPDIWLSSSRNSQCRSRASRSDTKPLTIEEMEKRQILSTLEFTNWNKSQAATILAIERSTLSRKVKSYQLRRRRQCVVCSGWLERTKSETENLSNREQTAVAG